MSRPHHRFLLPVLYVLPLAFSACVGTIYDRTYSNKVTHYKAPADKKEVSADALLSALDKGRPSDSSAPSGLPAANSDLPLTPPVPGDANATSPMSPSAGTPSAPAIPGLPPAN